MLCAHSHLTLCNPMDSKPPCPRPPCPSPSPRVCPSSCPLHQWCHPAISSSDTLFSFCLQSFPASGTFPMSWLFTSGNPNTGVSASASALPMSIQDWFPLRKCSLFQMAQMVKNLPAMQETWVRSLCWEDPLEEGMQPTPVFLPGESHGQRSLAGYGPWGHKDSDTTEWLSTTAQPPPNSPAYSSKRVKDVENWRILSISDHKTL